jgi:dihydrodipicolinate synthase/N-acetylneuraminate lyase
MSIGQSTSSPTGIPARQNALARDPLLPQLLRGIIPPMITPLRGRDVLDVAGLERLIEHIIAGGVHGLFILGTSGEAPSLSYRLRRELIDRACRQVARRVPVLVGITDTAIVELLHLARHAADAGAQALVLSAPYYFPPGQPELLEFLELLLPELPLPLFLYNMPMMTKVQFAPQTLRRVLHDERIIGVKDSSGDLDYFDQLLVLKRERPDWSVLVGPEHLLVETMRRGGCGGVNGGANYHPRLFVNLYEAVMRNDAGRVAELQDQLLKLRAIYAVGGHASSVIKGMKCACSLLGLCEGRMAEPFREFAPPEREKVRDILREAGLLPA